MLARVSPPDKINPMEKHAEQIANAVASLTKTDRSTWIGPRARPHAEALVCSRLPLEGKDDGMGKKCRDNFIGDSVCVCVCSCGSPISHVCV